LLWQVIMMRKNEYRKRRTHSGELRTPVTFYEYRPKKDSPYPDEYEYRELYSCWAKVDRVWLKDLETAKANNTVSDVTLTIRDPLGDYSPSNKHFLEIDALEYKDFVYNITSSQPDLQYRDFITIVAQLKDDMTWQ